MRPAPWARAITTGTFMWSTSRDGWTATAYDMGTGQAPRDSYFSDDKTNQPLVKEGDPIVFMNLVATNTSDKTLYISIDEPNLWATPVAKAYRKGVAKRHARDRQADEGPRDLVPQRGRRSPRLVPLPDGARRVLRFGFRAAVDPR